MSWTHPESTERKLCKSDALAIQLPSSSQYFVSDMIFYKGKLYMIGSYYQFGDKIQSEIHDYKRLNEIGIRMPKMLDVDVEKERIIKEYIEGDTIFDMVKKDEDVSLYIPQVKEMCKLLYPARTNIDYFPTNFVVHDQLLYYIDFECNDYMEEWNFENWGIKYWSRTEEFLDYLKSHE